MIPIRRLAMLAGLALGAVGLFGFTGLAAAPQQEACVSIYLEADGTELVNQTVCLPPA